MKYMKNTLNVQLCGQITLYNAPECAVSLSHVMVIACNMSLDNT